MKKRFAIMAVSLLSFALIPLTATAAGGGEVKLQQANVDVGNHAAIQRGAKYFVNYCLGCHSAKYVRYQLLKNVGLTEDDIKDNLMFGGGKIGDLMKIPMPAIMVPSTVPTRPGTNPITTATGVMRARMTFDIIMVAPCIIAETSRPTSCSR